VISLFSYFACGLLAGLLGGYLGLGGGVVIVPYLTMIAGVELKTAVPLSVTAIVVNSISSSTEYIKRGMINFELMVSLGIFMTLGNIAGSLVGPPMPESVLQFIFGLTLLYTAYAFVRKPENNGVTGHAADHKYYYHCLAGAFATGVLGAMIGVGGGLIIIPLLYVVFGLPLATARGTSSFLIGASSAASVAVYFFSNRIDVSIAPPLLVGTIIGGKIGGYLGSLAKPKAVKWLFLTLLLYLAVRFIYLAVGRWMG
jgi:uncharacterized membrane protein YfcA